MSGSLAAEPPVAEDTAEPRQAAPAQDRLDRQEDLDRRFQALGHNLSAPLRQAKVLSELLLGSYSDGLSEEGRAIVVLLNQVIEQSHKQMSALINSVADK